MGTGVLATAIRLSQAVYSHGPGCTLLGPGLPVPGMPSRPTPRSSCWHSRGLASTPVPMVLWVALVLPSHGDALVGLPLYHGYRVLATAIRLSQAVYSHRAWLYTAGPGPVLGLPCLAAHSTVGLGPQHGSACHDMLGGDGSGPTPKEGEALPPPCCHAVPVQGASLYGIQCTEPGSTLASTLPGHHGAIPWCAWLGHAWPSSPHRPYGPGAGRPRDSYRPIPW